MEIFRPAARATIITFPILDLEGRPKTGATSLDSEWIAWADTAGPTAAGNPGFQDMAGEAAEISTTALYALAIAATELPTASPYVCIRIISNVATQYVLIRTASTYANVTGIDGANIATPVTAGYMPIDVKQTIALTSMADNSVEKSLARTYFATQYLDTTVSSRSAPATGQTVNVVDTGAITAASFAAGAIDASAIAASAIGASELAADAIGASELAADAVAEIADAVWDEVIYGAHQTDNTAGKVMQRMYHATDYLVASILSGSIYADDFLGRTLTRGASGGRTVGQALMALRNKVSISAGTLTVTSNNDTTTEWTATIATEAVTAIVTSIDPA